MYTRSGLQLKLYAEDQVRARLREAENYRMLNRLRKQSRKRIRIPLQLSITNLGRKLTLWSERLNRKRSVFSSRGGRKEYSP
jgi:hypothetical protein